MWQPGFDFVEKSKSALRGFHRALCIYSHVHRGTPKQPGLVLGLDRGGSCLGVAYRIAAPDWTATLAYLRRREQATAVYRERHVAVRLADGSLVTALTYVADRSHAQYAGKLPRSELLRLVRQGRGESGRNPDYIRNTHTHLVELGLVDPTLAWLVDQLG
jgi:cation transport protein ChaC